MAKCRKPKREDPDPPEVEQTKDGVEVTFKGRILPPPVPPPAKPRHCKRCGEGPVPSKYRYGTTPGAYLYECPRCVDPETCRPTRWKEPR